ncbi:MAG: ABC transporter permease [Bacteroidota bacterium]|jgi:ABC-type antimicrobial peptide transport system permease subunit
MFRNYLKIALRNILRHKGYSFINIAGLAVGMACCIFLLLWVQDELSFDRFHAKADSLYRLEQDQKGPEGSFHVVVTPCPVAPALKSDIPEIVNSARYVNLGTMLLRYGDKAFFENGLRAVDPSFLEMFSFPLIKGDPRAALGQPHSIVISEDIAKKYFGSEDPLGKSFVVNTRYPFSVTGVMKNVPKNSSIGPEVLIPFDFTREFGRYNDSWSSNSILTFAEMRDPARLKDVNGKITEMIYRHNKETDNANWKPDFMLAPLRDMHLYTHFGFSRNAGAIQEVYLFIALGLFVLLIACINFMNLSTARSANRAKEVGLRKVVGASRRHVIGQFFGESILVSFLALIVALVIVLCLLPGFNTLSGKYLTAALLLRWETVAGLLGVTLLTGLVSGSYPALFLSSFQPIRVLKGTLQVGSKGGFFRKFLVVTQFSLSIILLIGTVVVYEQVKYMRTKNVGYDREQLLYLPLRGETRNSYEMLKTELLKDPQVLGVSGINDNPVSLGSNSWGADWDGKDPARDVLISEATVDFDYVETMKIPMVEGRTFSKAFSTDTSRAFLVNEELVKVMGVTSAVGKRFKFMDIEGTIVGVMKNYNYLSVESVIPPLALVVSPRFVQNAIVRLQKGDIPSEMDYVRTAWQKVNPLYPFEYRFFDDDFAVMYQGHEQMGAVIRYAAILALVIACLGLFGLASFMVEQRTKEIGVRKVLGASVPGITLMLSREFVKWVVVANLIAAPVAYYLANRWLQDFAYRVTIGWWIFGLALCLTIAIALLTVSYQSVRAARGNPVDSLRYE